MRVEFTIESESLRAQLRAAEAAASDMTPLMDAIGARLEQSGRDRIEVSNTGPDGTPWPKSFRVIAGQGGKTLLDTGRLRDSITYQVRPTEVSVGTNVVYAAIHQFGGEIRAKNGGALAFRLADGTKVVVGKVAIPARPYLGISKADEGVIQDLTKLHFEEALDA